MPAWFIEPRDPLIVRDGRPFGADPGARSRSLSFPAPSTTTGGFRGRSGLGDGGAFDRTRIDDVLKIAVRGPLLTALSADGAFVEWLPPAPADALLINYQASTAEWAAARQSKRIPPDARLVQLLPINKPDGADHSPFDVDRLLLIGSRQIVAQKPLSRPPRFWHWATFESWLSNPAEELCVAAELGITGPANESRSHVGIDPTTQTAEEGRLFQTNGLEFTAPDRRRLALVVTSEAPLPKFTRGGFAPLGGERRLVAWRPDAPEFPDCPQQIRDQIRKQRACRVLLLTPAHFTNGYRPDWLLDTRGGIASTLRAALVVRPQVISGWEMRANNGKGEPKATRRLAPAGSVYFVKLPDRDAASDGEIDAWIDATWMQNISDGAQERLDGFGLAALGNWDGTPINMEVQ